MMRRLRKGSLRRSLALGAAGLLLLASAVPAPAAPPPSAAPIVLTADHIQYNTRTGVAVAEGHVRASRGDVVITADHLEGNLTTGDVEAMGHVVLTQGRRVVTGTALSFSFQTQAGAIQQVSTQYGPWRLTGEHLETSPGRGIAYNAVITPCDPQHPAFLVTASQVVVVPGDHLTAYDASVFIYGMHIITVSTYTYSLRAGSREAQAGPRTGYDNLNGAYIEYGQYFPVGSASNFFRIRYGSTSGLTAEDFLTDREGDHVWTLDLGRSQGFDQNGNLFNLDRYSLDLTYDQHRLGNWVYTLQGQAGSYREIATGVSATRGEALLAMTPDVIRLSPSLIWIGAGQARVDVYGTGQERTVLGFTMGLTELLNPSNSLSLTYNLASVGGATPFLFDVISPDSTVALSYDYAAPGLLQSAGVSVSYSFLALQTTLGANAALALSPTLLLSVAGSYNLTTQQWGEIDYAVNATCDCLAVSLLYRTFPQSPAQNMLLFAIGLSPVAAAFSSFTP